MGSKGIPMTTVNTQPYTMIPRVKFEPYSIQLNCGNCGKNVMTTTEPENGACAWAAAIIVCLLCCPCFWIPLVMDYCKDVIHSCPACGAMLGSYRHL